MPSPARIADRSGRRRRQPPVIGITGGFGSGKSTVASFFAAWGGVVVSGDRAGHVVIDRSKRLRQRLAVAFGEDIFQDGTLDRSLLAARAFAGRRSLEQLNRIVHPPLIRELNSRIRHAQRRSTIRAVVVDAALLPEWGRHQVYWDWLVGVWAPRSLRVARLRKRGWSETQIRARMRLQMSWTARRRVIDYVVKNDSSLSDLERRARLCWRKLLCYYVGQAPTGGI